ncbi:MULTISPECIES: ABC transporter substrate-binding protein [unclassified Roseateles]|uniref:ABC transporter substrate-binding protein n=1 Tax=unclassified Roseateles TaxID=2626991 RepID=UPI0007011497|nr:MULTISPECIES: ABC transporter substrate-binding protein [unclassified Roseateles]KQW43487.1 ABC transporter substrate-binding protein [Pelomonas sp. Root405]KRA71225.1 ABC transporter substrate-binding protein [Pelomonas sp. Root662]
MKRFAVLALLTAASLAQAQAPEWKKLRIGVEGAYPPFSEIGPDGKLKGFEIELVQAYCAEMKAQCTLVQQDFDGLIPALQSRKVDAIFASVSITEERQKVIAFSKPYYATPARLVAKAGAKLDPTAASLKGKKIGVQRGTTHETYATAMFKQSEIVRYGSQDQVFLDLKSGRLDATLMDAPAADFGFLKKPEGKGFAFAGPAILDDKIFGVGTGVGMRKADEATLGKKFNAAIDVLQANGTFKKLADKYFDYDITPQKK